MRRLARRSFLKRTTLAIGAATSLAPHARALGANDDLRVATVGFRGQGGFHIRLLRELPGVRVVALCDADRAILERAVREARELGQPVEGYVDVRKLLENNDIDALTTATPNHWHVLVTVWGCQAGKDVYVEKPLSQNIFEGRKAIEAAEKYDRIVQWGNASRGHRTGPMHLERENLGKIRIVWSTLKGPRESIGKVDGPQEVPESVDYDLWTGPAPLEPLMRQNLHYDWHWVWSTGSGEIGNIGVYQLDAARLRLGQNVLPKRVMSLGGRFLFDDDGQTPNSQIALFQFDPGPLLIFELRNLPSEEGPRTISSRVRYEEGDAGLPAPTEPEGDPGGFPSHKGHLFNFISAVRSRRASDLRAPLIEGHLSSAMVHMANISYRLGKPGNVDAAREAIQDQGSEAMEVFEGFREHLAVNGVDFAKSEIVVGPWLEMDPQTEQFVGGSPLVASANELARGHYREPFVVPEQV